MRGSERLTVSRVAYCIRCGNKCQKYPAVIIDPVGYQCAALLFFIARPLKDSRRGSERLAVSEVAHSNCSVGIIVSQVHKKISTASSFFWFVVTVSHLLSSWQKERLVRGRSKKLELRKVIFFCCTSNPETSPFSQLPPFAVLWVLRLIGCWNVQNLTMKWRSKTMIAPREHTYSKKISTHCGTSRPHGI